MVAAGAVSCNVGLGDEDAAKVMNAPVLINTMHHTHGEFTIIIQGVAKSFEADVCLGESIPPNKDHRAKFNYELSFTEKTFHTPSGQHISMPPLEQSKSTWSQDVPQQPKDEVSRVVRHTYGDLITEKKDEEFRMCW